MVEQTRKGQKFQAARTFLQLNPRIASRLMNWQKMHGQTLYKALALSGVSWDKERKCWHEEKRMYNEAPSIVQVTPTRKIGENLTVKVRIIADEEHVNRALASLLEMAGALDWVLLRNSGIRKGHYGTGRLVYLVFRVPSF